MSRLKMQPQFLACRSALASKYFDNPSYVLLLPCSRRRIFPSSLQTRCISFKTWTGSSNEHKPKVSTTVSNDPSLYSDKSVESATTTSYRFCSDALMALILSLALSSILSDESVRTTLRTDDGYLPRFRPVPAPTSSALPLAWKKRRARRIKPMPITNSSFPI